MTHTPSRRLVAAALVALAAVSVAPAHAAPAGAAGDRPPRCHGRPATIVGTPGKDRIVGTRGADVIVARGGADRVQGAGGDDLICGGRGADELRGGTGSDRVYGGAGTDVVFADRGCICTEHSRVNHDQVEGGPGHDKIYSVGGTDLLRGGPGADWIFATGRAPTRVDGGAGDDEISQAPWVVSGSVARGGRGHDLLDLAPPFAVAGRVAGADVDEATGTVTVTADDGRSGVGTMSGFEAYAVQGSLRHPIAWTFVGDDRASRVRVDYGTLRASMGGGDDVVRGAEGHDVLDGGPGTDTVRHSAGADECVGFERGTC